MARAAKHVCAVVTDIASGRQLFVDGDKITGDLVLSEDELMDVRARIGAGRSGIAPYGHLVRVYAPQPRMVIVGAVHIAQALAPMAAAAGFAVTVIDPRRAFATEARFPGLELRDDWPDEALEAMGIDAHTAIVTLTHDPKLDDPALVAALNSPAFFVGSLGSKRTHEKRLARLREAGIAESEFARIHGPVGLDIGARSPSEIAVSIVAQVIAAKRRVTTR
jgi:xanthine dehydrogenase accessory factor